MSEEIQKMKYVKALNFLIDLGRIDSLIDQIEKDYQNTFYKAQPKGITYDKAGTSGNGFHSQTEEVAVELEQLQRQKGAYRKWKEDGWVQVNDGATVDFHNVTEWFAYMVREYNIRPLWIGYDAALSGYWREEMDSYGFDMEKIRQGPFTWTYPFKELAGLFEEHRVIYQNNPVLLWCYKLNEKTC